MIVPGIGIQITESLYAAISLIVRVDDVDVTRSLPHSVSRWFNIAGRYNVRSSRLFSIIPRERSYIIPIFQSSLDYLWRGNLF